MHRRVNVVLPEETVRLIDHVAEKGSRSRFIDQAVRHYLEAVGRSNIRKLMKERAVRRAELDLQLAREWFSLEKVGQRME